MDITLDELLKGKPTVIKGKEYMATAGYVEPFLDRLNRLTNDFRIHVQLPEQYTKTVDGDVDTNDITYNRVYIEAVMPDELCYSMHDKVIGMVMGLDTRKPVAKFYNGALNSACTNLCVFSPEYLSCQAIEAGQPLDYKYLDKIVELKDNTKATLEMLHNTTVRNLIGEQERLLGQWVRNAMMCNYDNGFSPVKLSVDNVVQAFKSLFIKDDSPYFQIGPEVNMFDVYNAFTQQITNAVDRGKDILNSCEKTLLLRQILQF